MTKSECSCGMKEGIYVKIKRSERLVDLTYYLLDHPYELVSLTYFAERFNSAKSSVSEDLAIIKERFESQGIGVLETVAGAAGGARFIPKISRQTQEELIQDLIHEINHSERLLPGGFIYLSDILGDPKWLKVIGKVIANQFLDKEIDTVMTVATSGIAVAQSVATYLNVPFKIVTRDPKVTEGSTVSVNYVSGADNQRVEKMELSRRSLAPNSNVLVVDDFIRSGGTIEGMESLLNEFDANLVGAAVVVENLKDRQAVDKHYQTLISVTDIDEPTKTIDFTLGSFFE